ncbi:MAG: excisionase family DNA-binding protein [Dehalococcoidia bacterium]
MDKLLLKPIEAAELVGLGRSKCYEMIRDGTIPSVRLGKSVRIPADALRRWVDTLTGPVEGTERDE